MSDRPKWRYESKLLKGNTTVHEGGMKIKVLKVNLLYYKRITEQYLGFLQSNFGAIYPASTCKKDWQGSYLQRG